MEKHGIQRVKKKYTCPNPLFVKWLTEWKQEAAEKGLKLQYTYAKALHSLKKYPLPLKSGKEAKILENFGDKICALLDKKLEEYRASNSLPSSLSASSESSSSLGSSESSSKKRSVTPLKTAKTSASAAAQRNLPSVQKGIKRTFSAIKEDLVPPTAVVKENNHTAFFLSPGSFNIILCVDNCETLAGKGRSKQQCIAELQKSGVEYEVRKLHVGDFAWVARDNRDSKRELVLDFIVERKRMDDLAHSIKDGRFREQKFRMKNSGLKNPIYLVEKCSGAAYLGLPESTLDQALVNTQVIEGFIVKRTQGIKESISYLATMTRMLRTKYQNITLRSGSRDEVKNKSPSSNIFLSFDDFNTSSIKNKSLTVKEMFAKHLLQFFGLSVDKVAAIVDKYPTLSLFLEAYEKCKSDSEKLQMVSLMKYGINKKNIGPALSKNLMLYYSPS